MVGRNYRLAALGRILDIESPELAIIFTRTRMEVDDLTEALRARGYGIEALHGGLDQPTRDRVMKRARSGQIDAIVATDVAARGIDLENLTHVINYGIPASVETYVHRIGRTGRAGRTGTAITILEPREHRHLRAIEQITKTRIEIRSVPSATDVRAKRLETMRRRLEDVLEGGDLDRFHVIVEALGDSYDVFDIAAAAIKLADAVESGEEDTADIPTFAPFERPRRERSAKDRPHRERSRTVEPGMTRLFLNVGRLSNVRPADLVGAIANEADIPARAIGNIEITERFSLVDVADEQAEKVLAAMTGVRIKGREVQCRRDNGPVRSGDDRFAQRSRSDRRGPRR